MMDLISREAALDCFHDWIDRHGDVHTPDEMAEYIAIEALPFVESEKRMEELTETHACDCISRQAAIDELRDYFVKDVQFGDELTAGYNDGIDMAIATISKISSAQPDPCDDAVSRKAAIKCCTFGRTSLGLIDELRRLPSVTPEQRWIPCSERLPEDGQQVLIQMLFGKMSVIKFCATGLTAHIVAWMPLPAPYEERREDG